MSKLFVDEIVHKSSQGSGTITIGASGETTNIVGTLQNNGAGVGPTSIDDNGNATAISIDSSEVVRFPVGILRLQNATTGTADTDGLLLEVSGNDVYINNKENASIYFRTNNSDRMLIDSGGQLVVTANKPNDLVTHFKNTTGTNPYGLAFTFTAAAPDNNSTYFISGADSVTDRFRIWSDGDVVNHDNSYGSISDERIKSNIVNANSQWNDIKAVKVRNYKKNDDIAQYGDNASTELGVIAQELEASNMNGLVKDEVLYTAEDKEVIDGDKNVGDIKNYKSVKYSILYMKSIKALQEAMERIETLEAKVTALENA